MNLIFGLAPLLALSILSGCEPTVIERPVQVNVPVPVRVLPPAELTNPPAPTALPQWVAPSNPAATSCLTAEGEQVLKGLVADSADRTKALKAWAEGPP